MITWFYLIITYWKYNDYIIITLLLRIVTGIRVLLLPIIISIITYYYGFGQKKMVLLVRR